MAVQDSLHNVLSSNTGGILKLQQPRVRLELVDSEASRHSFPFHVSLLRCDLLVELRNDLQRGRLLQLRATGVDSDWQDRCVEWIVPTVTIPESAGGATLQEYVSQNTFPGREWVYISPASTEGAPMKREIGCRFLPALNSQLSPGTHELKIQVHEFKSDGTLALAESKSLILEVVNPGCPLAMSLPSIYCTGDDDQSATSFLHRFLLGFQSSKNEFDGLISNVEQFFGPATAPREFLNWLATWVALTLDDTWSESKSRQLISEAFDLYSRRGTKKGLLRFLEIYCGVEPVIRDRPVFGLRLGRSSPIGTQSRLGDLAIGSFMVTVGVPRNTNVSENVIRQIIDDYKPAHTNYSLKIVPYYPEEVYMGIGGESNVS